MECEDQDHRSFLVTHPTGRAHSAQAGLGVHEEWQKGVDRKYRRKPCLLLAYETRGLVAAGFTRECSTGLWFLAMVPSVLMASQSVIRGVTIVKGFILPCVRLHLFEQKRKTQQNVYPGDFKKSWVFSRKSNPHELEGENTC